MTEIKCRYSIPYCYYDGMNRKRVHHNEYWWCDCNDYCEIGMYKKPPSSGERTQATIFGKITILDVINPTCVHCEYEDGEFATTVKRYSWEDGELTVAGRTLSKDEIKYLEIDGRVLIGKEANNVHD